MKYRIAEARKQRGMTQAQLAKKMGTSQQNVQRWESGKMQPRADTIAKMARILNSTMDYLLGLDTSKTAPYIPSREIEVPLYGSIAAGTPIEMIPVDETFSIPSAMHDRYPNAFLLKVDGNSMNRILPNGSYALIDPCETIDEDMQPYAVCVNGYDATIKRIEKLANGLRLIPDSNDPTFRPQVYDYSDPNSPKITVIGRVVWYTLPYKWEF